MCTVDIVMSTDNANHPDSKTENRHSNNSACKYRFRQCDVLHVQDSEQFQISNFYERSYFHLLITNEMNKRHNIVMIMLGILGY